jgi:UDP-N-acetylenolpyruvoylglucosamine reductase
MKKLEQYLQERKIEYYHDHDIKPYLTMGIGGNVQEIILVEKLSQLIDLLHFIAAGRYPFILLGGGSNVVFSDAFTPLPVIINRTQEIIKCEESHIVKINSGVLNKDFLTWAIENRVGGMDSRGHWRRRRCQCRRFWTVHLHCAGKSRYLSTRFR